MRYLNILITSNILIFREKSIIYSSITPYEKIQKRFIALSFYRIRESIVSKIIRFYFIPIEINLEDVLSKYLEYSQIWNLFKSLLF